MVIKKSVKKLILVFMAIFIALNSQAASATNDLFYATNNIQFYDPEDICLLGNADTTTLIGTDNTDKTMRYLVTRGLTTEQAASIVASLSISSGVNPAQGADTTGQPVNGTAYGIAGWSLAEQQNNLVSLANTRKLEVNTLELQIEYLWTDINSTEINLVSEIKNTISTDDASLLFYSKYINSSIDSNNSLQSNLFDEAGSLAEEYTDKLATSKPTCNSGSSGYVGNDFIVYNQNDPAWGGQPYGTSTIAREGCGPSAMAAIITALTKQSVTPAQTAAFGRANGTSAPGGGSYWNIDTIIGRNWGLSTKSLNRDVNQINDGLRSGGLVIMSGRGPTPYTSSGHFIVIRAVAENGNWLIADSNGKLGQSNSIKEWDPNYILTYTREYVRLLTLGNT